MVDNVIKNVETYTYIDEVNNGPFEVLLIGVNPQEIGSENTFEPSGFYREHITTWIKKRYYFLDGFLYAQIPVKFKNYPDIVLKQFCNESSFVKNVTYEEDENKVHIYYPISESESICLSWDLNVDHWSMNKVPQPSNETIELDKGHAKETESVWKSI